MRRAILLTLTGLLVVGLLTAWSADRQPTQAQPAGQNRAAQSTATLFDQPRAVDLPVQQTSTPTPGEPEKQTVRIWWPDELYPQHAGSTLDILNAQFDGFQITYSTYDLDMRRKRTNGLGGILSTLRAAQPVAPGALPDLTLMRRSDMVTAANEGLIFPITDWVPADLVGTNLLPGAQALGEIDGVLYGVPYAIDLYHIVYRLSAYEQAPVSFADVLAEKAHYLFPVGTTPVSWTVLLQYRGAGGRLVDDNGAPTLDLAPLLAVLDYYAQGLAQGIFSPDMLDYTRYEDLWSQFNTGEADMIGVSAWSYLAHDEDLSSVGFGTVPTLDGEPITALDGWLWVLTTQNPEHQQRALAFLSWMMRISPQSLYTESLGVLPSQVRALRLWDNEAYATFARTLADSAVIIPEAQRNNSAALALQQAIIDVLNGTPPETAGDAALARLASG